METDIQFNFYFFFTIDMNCVSAYPLLFPCLQSRYQCLKCENAELSCLVQKASLVFGQVVRDQETAHEEFFVLADGPNLTGNQIYCICRSRTRRRYTDERNITRYCSGRDFCDAADNFGSDHVWPVRAKSVKVLWIFKVVERSLDILILPKDIQSLFAEV